jgi:hypothetical protein
VRVRPWLQPSNVETPILAPLGRAIQVPALLTVHGFFCSSAAVRIFNLSDEQRSRLVVQERGYNSRVGLLMALPSLSVSRFVAALLLGLCFVAGCLTAGWWWGTRDTTPLARICGRVDYINGLQQEFGGDAAEEVREQLKALVEECQSALRNRAEGSD